jgi:hypothetical protein
MLPSPYPVRLNGKRLQNLNTCIKGNNAETEKILVPYGSVRGRFDCDYIQHTADILVRLVKT